MGSQPMSAKLAVVASRSPTLCGECKTCRSAGGFLQRFREYIVNLDDGEPETTDGAIKWMTEGYSKCPVPGKLVKPKGFEGAHVDF